MSDEKKLQLTPELFKRLSNNEHFKIYGKTRKDMHTDGALFNIDSGTKGMGIVHSASITQHLFGHLYPWAEDGNHGITFEERVGDMISAYKKAIRGSEKNYATFSFQFKTYIKEVRVFDKVGDENVECDTFPNGGSKTKIIDCFVTLHAGDFEEPVLTFGLDRTRWLT